MHTLKTKALNSATTCECKNGHRETDIAERWTRQKSYATSAHLVWNTNLRRRHVCKDVSYLMSY